MAFNPAGFVINAAGHVTIDIPVAHLFNQTQFRLCGIPNVAAGTVEYPLALLSGLAFAFREETQLTQLSWMHSTMACMA